MIGIVIVDGTGTDTFVAPNDDQYRVDYNNSACSRISRMFPCTTYQRGPWLDGRNFAPLVDEAYNHAFSLMYGRGCKGLCLIGHSRGGAVVIAVAHRLKEQNIDVGFMGLFDAVEMDLNFQWDVDTVPDNVKAVFHAERIPATLSRHLWGNCGDAWDGGTMRRRLLWGTHGAIGGVPPGLPPDHERPPDEYVWEAASFIPTRVTVAQAQWAAIEAWDFIVNQGLKPALARMEAEPVRDPGLPSVWPPNWPNRPPVQHPGNGGGNYPGRTHIVVRGESLSIISGKFYGDVLLWPVIYDANKGTVSNPNVIQPDQRLSIPSIAGYSKARLDAIRQRGRHC